MCPTTKVGFCFVGVRSRGRGHGSGDLIHKRSQRDCSSSVGKVMDFLSNIRFNLDNWRPIDVELRKPCSSLLRDTGFFLIDEEEFF